MTNEAYILIGTLGAVAITGTVAVINNLINKRHETKKQKRELILKLGLETWQTLANNPQVEGNLFLPESFIAHMSRLIDVLLEDEFDEEKYKQKIEESIKFSEQMKPIIKGTKQSTKQEQKVQTGDDTKSDIMDFPPKVY